MHVTSVQCLLSTVATVLKLENYSHTWILPTVCSPKATLKLPNFLQHFLPVQRKFNEHVWLFEKPAIF